MIKTITLYSILILTILVGVFSPAISYSQNKNLIISVKEKSLSEIFKSVENQTSLKFSYDQGDVNLAQKLTINYSGGINGLLSELSSKTNLDFKVLGNSISVRRSQSVELPTKIITGIITDKTDGQTIPGANIFIKNTKKGAVSNIKGEFTLKITDANIPELVLVVSFLGMKTKEVKVGNQSFFNIALERDAVMMNDVIVTSSYTKEKRREDVVGSISQISSAQLQADRPIESFDKMLEGLVAGVQVETNTELGTPVKINIRGQGSLPPLSSGRATSTTSSQPLFVVDGVPMYEQQKRNENSAFGREDNLNPLSNINPEDIKTISVLKDATASALYGANAANGVIIITTKSGSIGKTKVNLSFDAGTSEFINEFKWLSGPEYYSLLRETYINEGRSVAVATQLAGDPNINTDWFALTNRNATYQNTNLDISGGNEETTFRVSLGYRNQEANSLRNDLQKTYLRIRLDHQASKKLRIGLSLSPTVSKKNALSNFGSVLLPPNISPFNPDGSYTLINGVPNPIAVLAQNDNFHNGLQLIGNVNASYKISDAWAVSGTLGADFYQNKQTAYLSALNESGANRNGFLEIYDRNYRGYIGFLQATYDKTYFDKHSVNFLIGSQVEDKTTNLLGGQGADFAIDRLRVLSSAARQQSLSSTSEDATVSYYSQLGYDLSKKYYANINARVDESSVFGGDKQVALNGSIGLAWVLSKENFLKDSKNINLLKIRATYGSTGNSRIGTYAARGLYDFGLSSGNFYNGNISSIPDGEAAPNPNLGWERNYKFNLGLDVTLFNKVQLTAEYYVNTLRDLISSVNVPNEIGFKTVLANTSSMRNSGFELTLQTDNINRSNFSWNTNFNIGTNKNKLIAFNNDFAQYGSAENGTGLVVGNSSTAIYGFQWAGVDPQTGMELFYDPAGNKVDANTIQALPLSARQVLGDRLPDFQGGIINNFSYKNLSFSFNVLYTYGGQFKFSNVSESDGRNLQNRNQSVNLLDRWQRPGDITDIPRPTINRDLVANSSRYVFDLSYLKLANVSLNYKIPESLVNKLKLKSASLFSNVSNIFYLYSDQGTKGRNGVAEKRFSYPESRAFIGGLRVGI